jgi:hypothetical protein
MSKEDIQEALQAAESVWLVTEPSGRRRPVTKRDVADAIACSSSLEEAEQTLMSVGLAQRYAAIVLKVFQDHNTLETEGIWAGLTARQRHLAMIDAANLIDMGESQEQAIKSLVADGYTLEQATYAVVDHLAERHFAQRAGAPKLMITGAGVTALGVAASVLSASLQTSYYRIYIGAIVCGVIMIVVGAYRRLR